MATHITDCIAKKSSVTSFPRYMDFTKEIKCQNDIYVYVRYI